MIYLDHAATTPISPSVLKKMLPFLEKQFGNPSSLYKLGREARAAIDNARNTIAKTLNCKPQEIIFTSSGTEANNWAVLGIAEANKHKGHHLITTKIEHHSILDPLKQLELKGFKVTYLDVDQNGTISLENLKNAITAETILISIAYANNEIGTVQNLSGIAQLLHNKNIVLHTDACQAAAYLPLEVQKLGITSMTINGGKIYGPKGSGALYIQENIKITPLIYGGGQEHRMRAGTENVANIVGLAEALKLITQKNTQISPLRDYFLDELLKIPGITLNGSKEQRLPNNINISIEGVGAESLIVRLDMEDIYVSAGSACSSGSVEPSHVLTALGLPPDKINNSIRITLGEENTKQEIDKVLQILPKIINELRSIKSKINTL